MTLMHVKQNSTNTVYSEYKEKHSEERKTGRARSNSRDLTGQPTQTLSYNWCMQLRTMMRLAKT